MHLPPNYLAYLVVYMCLLCPPPAFQKLGFTVESIFQKRFGSEQYSFIDYHLYKITVNRIIHAALLVCLMYPIGRQARDIYYSLYSVDIITIGVLIGCGLIIARALWCARAGFKYHPTICGVRSLVDNWRLLIDTINTEFSQPDVILIETSSTKLLIGKDWLAYASTYWLHLANQRDVDMMILKAADIINGEGVPQQILTIKVTTIHEDMTPFEICLNSIEYERVEAKLHRPIRNALNILVLQSVSARSVQAFKEILAENTRAYHENVTFKKSIAYDPNICAGCMNEPANVILWRMCTPPDSTQPLEGYTSCESCMCTRPMWCADCMAKWFFSCQNQAHPERWLAGKAPCPTCRKCFCVFDVCLQETKKKLSEVGLDLYS